MDIYSLEAIEAVKKHGSQTAAARALGIARSTLQSRIERANRPEQANPLSDTVAKLRDELEVTRKALADAVRPRFTVRQDNIKRSEKIRVLAIGDAHDSPLLPKDRFEWIGKYANESRPDIIIQIGDFATLDSLNTHVANETYHGKSKPTFLQDMESFNLALQAMDSAINTKPEKHCTLGNHERRLFLFEDKAPEAYGMMQHEMQSIFERYGWTSSPYGQITMYGGVGFVHAALNRLGKTMGGKTAENTIANESVHDLVIGHSHVERIHRAPKIGGGNWVSILNLGCALPDGHIEDYALHSLTGWSWGITEIDIQHGHITNRNWVSMARLGELYG